MLKGYTSRDPEVLMSGPAGTGKTVAWLLHCYNTAAQYPGARVLIVRKSRASLTDSVLVTFERDILGPNHPIFSRSRVARLNRSSYRLANGSEIVLGGMDKPDKVLSSEYDLILCPEGTDLDVTDWETLGGRLRSNAVPYQQIISDCNPTSPQHWLYQRCMNGLTKLIPTTHRDNPAFWDPVKKNWTDRGRVYLSRLDRMTGSRRARFLEGLWVQAEGVCFDGWEDAIHVIDPIDIPYHWPLYLTIDFGHTNPFACQFWREDHDGRIYLTHQIYHSRRIVEDHCKLINDILKPLPKPVFTVCDHDAGDRATFERHTGLYTVAAEKGDNAGIQEVCERLKPAGDGLPRMFVFRDSLAHAPDPQLLAESKPTHFAAEVPGYVWDTAAKAKERPVKKNDHACLIAGTMVETDLGRKPIEEISHGDMVLTREGYRPVIDAGMTQPLASVYAIQLSSGETLCSTSDHLIWVLGKEWTAVSDVNIGDHLEALPPCHRFSFCRKKERQFAFDSTVLSTDATQNPSIFQTGSIIEPGSRTSSRGTRICTETFGSTGLEKYQKGLRFTTATATLITTKLGICNCSVKMNTRMRTRLNRRQECDEGCCRCLAKILPRASTKCDLGTVRQKELNGTETTPRTSQKIHRWLASSAETAIRRIKQNQEMRPDRFFVDRTAGLPAAKEAVSMTSKGRVFAGDNFERTSTQRRSSAALIVLGVEFAGMQPVYNLTVEGQPEFYANGVLVHNCDAARYLCRYLANHGGGRDERHVPADWSKTPLGYDPRKASY